MSKKSYLSPKGRKAGRVVLDDASPALSIAEAKKSSVALAENDSDVMTLEEAAAYLRTSRPSLLKGIKNGDVPCLKIGTLYRLSRAALQTEMRNKMSLLTTRSKIPKIDDEASRRQEGGHHGDG